MYCKNKDPKQPLTCHQPLSFKIYEILTFDYLNTSNYLGPSINRLVTDRNTKFSCRGFVLAQFQSTSVYIIHSKHTLDYTKLFLVCKVEILQVTVNKN